MNALLFGVLALIPILPVQGLTIVAYVFGRNFVLGSYFYLMQTAFGTRTFGKVSGTALFISGVTILLLIPLKLVIGDQFFLVNLIFTLLCLPLFVIPVALWRIAVRV